MKKKPSCLKPQGLEPLYLVCKQVFCMVGGCRVLLSAQRLYYMYGRDQLYCSPTNGLNHYLPLIKTGAHSTGERFRATTISPSAGMMFEWASKFCMMLSQLPHSTLIHDILNTLACEMKSNAQLR